MPGENVEYSGSEPKSISSMSIGIGTTLLIFGVPLACFPPSMPVGATFVTIGGVLVGGAVTSKIGSHVRRKKREKREQKEQAKQNMPNMHERLINSGNNDDEELNKVFDDPQTGKVVDFKATRSTTKQFDNSQINTSHITETKEKRHAKRKQQ